MHFDRTVVANEPRLCAGSATTTTACALDKIYTDSIPLGLVGVLIIA